jgi:hypothetical protein
LEYTPFTAIMRYYHQRINMPQMTITLRAKEEVVVIYFHVLFQNLFGNTESKHERTTG